MLVVKEYYHSQSISYFCNVNCFSLSVEQYGNCFIYVYMYIIGFTLFSYFVHYHINLLFNSRTFVGNISIVNIETNLTLVLSVGKSLVN